MQLTKDSDKLICLIYLSYLDKIELGSSKYDALRFPSDFYITNSELLEWHNVDISNCLNQLRDNGLIMLSLSNSFIITKDGIIYMENRFKNGLKELLSYIALLK